jgi:hypothetical protein
MSRFVTRFEAEAAAGRGADTWSLRRDGDDWLVEAGDEQARLRAHRGLVHLATLLGNPHRDNAACYLDAGEDAPPVQAGVPLLDERALTEYRRRLEEIAARAGCRGSRG